MQALQKEDVCVKEIILVCIKRDQNILEQELWLMKCQVVCILWKVSQLFPNQPLLDNSWSF